MKEFRQDIIEAVVYPRDTFLRIIEKGKLWPSILLILVASLIISLSSLYSPFSSGWSLWQIPPSLVLTMLAVLAAVVLSSLWALIFRRKPRWLDAFRLAGFVLLPVILLGIAQALAFVLLNGLGDMGWIQATRLRTARSYATGLTGIVTIVWLVGMFWMAAGVLYPKVRYRALMLLLVYIAFIAVQGPVRRSSSKFSGWYRFISRRETVKDTVARAISEGADLVLQGNPEAGMAKLETAAARIDKLQRRGLAWPPTHFEAASDLIQFYKGVALYTKQDYAEAINLLTKAGESKKIVFSFALGLGQDTVPVSGNDAKQVSTVLAGNALYYQGDFQAAFYKARESWFPGPERFMSFSAQGGVTATVRTPEGPLPLVRMEATIVRSDRPLSQVPFTLFTGPNGSVLIHNLKPGTYRLHLRNGERRLVSASYVEFEVQDDLVDLGIIKLVPIPTFEPLLPAKEARVSPSELVFKWTPLPGASSYTVSISMRPKGSNLRASVHLLWSKRLAEPEWTFNPSEARFDTKNIGQFEWSPDIIYSWTVTGYDEQGMFLDSTGGTFTIE